MTYLEMLEKEELQLMQTLARNRDSQKTISIEVFENDYKIKVGERISFISSKKIIEGAITGFEFAGCRIVMPICSKRNRDGSVGKYTHRITSEELKTIKKSNDSVNKYI